MRETIAVDRIDTSATLVSIHRIAIARPLLVFGVLSPYPTVVMVTTAQ